MNRMMKKIVFTACLCTGIAALMAARGGCVPDPCPNLYIACPDVECPDGFQVDKSGCAICECIGEPAPASCQQNSDCDAGQRCDIENFCDASPDCEEGMDCLAVCYGRCVDDPPADVCETRERERCETDGLCQLVEMPLGMPCACDCPPDGVDCICDDCDDLGWACIPVEPPPPPAECFADSDCPRGFYCETFLDCSSDDLDCGMMVGGVCLPDNPPPPSACLSDSDCRDGGVCDISNFCDAPPGCEEGMDCLAVCYGRCVDPGPSGECFADSDCPRGSQCVRHFDCQPGDLDCGMVPGTCEPVEPNACENLDERSCIADSSCQPRYEEASACPAGLPGEECPPCLSEGLFVGCEPADPGLTCANVDCAPGFTCIMEQVNCFTDPCPPMPVCVPVDPPVVCGDGSDLLCDMIPPVCQRGLVLGVFNNCFECVQPERCEPPPPPTCGDGSELMCRMMIPVCEPGLVVGIFNGCYECVSPDRCGPQITCDNVLCTSGTHCEMQDVVCVTSPCPPQPVCVPDEPQPSCANVRCAAGTHCEMQDVVCVTEPCLPIPACVPDEPPTTCSTDNDCGAGFACNTCPSDPNCPMCDVCGPAVCEPITDPPICAEGSTCTDGSRCINGRCG